VDPLILTIVLSLFNPYINITSQNFSSTPFYLLFIILYSPPPCGSTPVLPSYLLLRHSCTWDKISNSLIVLVHIGSIKSISWIVVYMALGDHNHPKKSGVYNTREIKSNLLRVKHIALRDQVHPLKSGACSPRDMKFIPWRVEHKTLRRSSPSYGVWCI